MAGLIKRSRGSSPGAINFFRELPSLIYFLSWSLINKDCSVIKTLDLILLPRQERVSKYARNGPKMSNI